MRRYGHRGIPDTRKGRGTRYTDAEDDDGVMLNWGVVGYKALFASEYHLPCIQTHEVQGAVIKRCWRTRHY